MASDVDDVSTAVEGEKRPETYAFDVAARLLEHERAADLDGSGSRRPRPAAEALAKRLPVVVTLLHHRLVEDVLARAALHQYVYAAQDLRVYAALTALVLCPSLSTPSSPSPSTR